MFISPDYDGVLFSPKFGPMLLVFLGLCGGSLLAGDAAGTNAADMVPLVLKLPAAHYAGTPPQGTTFSGIQDTPDPTVKIPKGVKNIAPQAKLTCSAKSITRAELAKVTDGDKEAEEDSVVDLPKGLQWIQFNFSTPQDIYVIAIWHAHDSRKVYHSVIAQVADDPDFTENVRTLFNNDRENKEGLGAGTDRQYFEIFPRQAHRCRGSAGPLRPPLLGWQHGEHFKRYTEVEIRPSRQVDSPRPCLRTGIC